ncbi:alpha/beta hydrolase fold domain-containing protein [Acinetobacter bereziniae]|nr:alpha/beta hydrolase fold domain-containing protein [Acinetobacter bereziniae]MBJ8458341.1 alpha/beta hydrolase fold domain-containing protein [Acinetobacter bereziniae]MBO3654902.1 alpha/beta hydrolase fold domain-containing protein [Acinetobacter bereziniae]
MFACEYDPVRDDAERYAERLKNAGIDVKLHLLTGMIHGAIHMTAITSEARKIYQKIELAID